MSDSRKNKHKNNKNRAETNSFVMNNSENKEFEANSDENIEDIVVQSDDTVFEMPDTVSESELMQNESPENEKEAEIENEPAKKSEKNKKLNFFDELKNKKKSAEKINENKTKPQKKEKDKNASDNKSVKDKKKKSKEFKLKRIDFKKKFNQVKEFFRKNKKLSDYLLITGILLVIFGLLVMFSLLSRNKWQTGLKQKIETVLSENDYPVKKIEGSYIPLSNSFSTNCAAYSLYDENNPAAQKIVCITKMVTLYGPVASVFIYSDGGNVEFIGFADCEKGISEQIKSVSEKSQINYWKRKLPALIEGRKIK